MCPCELFYAYGTTRVPLLFLTAAPVLQSCFLLIFSLQFFFFLNDAPREPFLSGCFSLLAPVSLSFGHARTLPFCFSNQVCSAVFGPPPLHADQSKSRQRSPIDALSFSGGPPTFFPPSFCSVAITQNGEKPYVLPFLTFLFPSEMETAQLFVPFPSSPPESP